MTNELGLLKRAGSPIAELSMPAAKVPRTQTSQLQINYLARQRKDVLPLASTEDSLPRILRLLGEYDGVLQRHESMAGNLGACPLGPILLKRFERLFEGPPRVLKSHARNPEISWLDVVEFAQSKPDQFNLEKQRNGIRVCQFYYKQCRIEISEEDYVLIASGMPQKLIPPQPILEDEEKELGVMEILDRNMSKVVQVADQVSARARQLIHKMKNRRAAILARREAEGDAQKPMLRSNDATISPIDPNGLGKPVRSIETSQSPPLGFTAVNMRQSLGNADPPVPVSAKEPPPSIESSRNGTALIANTLKHASPSTRSDWMNKFLTPGERAAGMTADTVRRESLGGEVALLADDDRGMTFGGLPSTTPKRAEIRRHSVDQLHAQSNSKDAAQQAPSVPIPNTPASLMPQSKPHQMSRDDGGPFKVEMIARMENMQRGERVIPPCDRCRRLQMDCIKNLTACQGCTKKHAKCSWKDVTPEELQNTAPPPNSEQAKGAPTSERGTPAPHPREWDNSLHRNDAKDPTEKAQSPRKSADTIEVASNKPLTPQITSPPAAIPRPVSHSHSHSSPRLDVRPPPLEQQSIDSANGKPPGQYPRFSSYGNTEKPSRNEHDEGDRLALVAAQVYRSASQSAPRPPVS